MGGDRSQLSLILSIREAGSPFRSEVMGRASSRPLCSSDLQVEPQYVSEFLSLSVYLDFISPQKPCMTSVDIVSEQGLLAPNPAKYTSSCL